MKFSSNFINFIALRRDKNLIPMALHSTTQLIPDILPLHWGMGKQKMQSIVPPLTPDLHKGSCGRVAVVGGSVEYTGAPFYAATSALKVGADLSFVLTSQEASLPIKCYGPELMVMPIYCTENFNNISSEAETNRLIQQSVEKVESMLPRTHSVVMGPGLGRHPAVMQIAAQVLLLCKIQKKPIVVDADGLWMVNSNLDILRQAGNNSHIILTPNAAEFQRLFDAVQQQSILAKEEEGIQSIEPLGNEFGMECQARALKLSSVSRALGGVTILLKGSTDLVSNGCCTIAVMGEVGSPRRCGGMGDILAGSIGVMLHWALTSPPAENEESEQLIDQLSPAMWACWGSCILTKRSAEKAFLIHRRSTTAPDLLDQIGVVGESMFPTMQS